MLYLRGEENGGPRVVIRLSPAPAVAKRVRNYELRENIFDDIIRFISGGGIRRTLRACD